MANKNENARQTDIVKRAMEEMQANVAPSQMGSPNRNKLTEGLLNPDHPDTPLIQKHSKNINPDIYRISPGS